MKTLKLQFVGVKGPILPSDEMTGDPETGIEVIDNDRQIALLNLECTLAYLVYCTLKEKGKVESLKQQKREVLTIVADIKERLNEINDGSFVVEDLISDESI